MDVLCIYAYIVVSRVKWTFCVLMLILLYLG